MQVATRQQNSYKPRIRAIAPFKPEPWQRAPLLDKSPTLLLTGSAGGGKSKTAAEKLHAYCLKYPGAMALMLRKVKVSMTSGAVLMMDRKVIGNDPNVTHVPSKSRFEYSNGSILAYAGLEDEKQRERLKSIGQDGAVDIAWMEEATEFEEEDYNALLARMRGKAAPWRQIILSCNPDAPTHWIKRRMIDGGEAHVYYSSAADNPYNPDDYKQTLAKLTGIDHDRLVDGKWVQAAGIVYDVWTDGPETGNVTEAAEYIPGAGPIYWFLDDGYSAGSAPRSKGIDPKAGHYVGDSHPRVFLLAQLKPDGRVDVFYENYACLRLSDGHIKEIQALPYPSPEYVVHGPGFAEIRGRLYEAGLYPRQCTAQVEESIKELRNALAPDENAWRKVRVHPRCKHLRAEMASYSRDKHSEKPVKAFDHGPDALRGGLWVLRFEV